jgi:hypothetical protein
MLAIPPSADPGGRATGADQGDRAYKWPLGSLAFHQLVEQGGVREVDLLDGGERLGDERVESGLGDKQGRLVIPERLYERLYGISAELSTSQSPFDAGSTLLHIPMPRKPGSPRTPYAGP